VSVRSYVKTMTAGDYFAEAAKRTSSWGNHVVDMDQGPSPRWTRRILESSLRVIHSPTNHQPNLISFLLLNRVASETLAYCELKNAFHRSSTFLVVATAFLS
jgi:hypothetical protein